MPDEEGGTPEVLDDLLLGFEPFKKKPDQSVQDDVDEFMEFMGFLPGTLHCCTHAFPWLYGDLEDPRWLGQTGHALIECILHTEPKEAFFFVSCLLLEATYEREKTDWMYMIKVMVRDKVVYFPLPIAAMSENSKCLFKEVFRSAQTEET